ncbi:trimethylguanosine synthase [Phyllosticta citricarpa]
MQEEQYHEYYGDDAYEEEYEPTAWHYDSIEEVPKTIRKYFHQRYHLFERYDEGVLLTDDAWFGVTPENVAQTIATHIGNAAGSEKTTIVDAFAGVGGNAIAFALSGRWERIFAIEKDAETLKCAKHNAEIYGVANKIWWIQGDCLDIVPKRFPNMKEAVVFASPPWGGVSYRHQPVFDLETMQPYGLKELYRTLSRCSKELVLYLPRTSDLNQIARYAADETKTMVAHYCLRECHYCYPLASQTLHLSTTIRSLGASNMPHAVDQQEQADDELINQLLAADPTDNALEGLLTGERFDHEPKADDAVDYEDIGDDDLADEDVAIKTENANGDVDADGDNVMDDLFSEAKPGDGADAEAEHDDFDDLFGDGPSSPPPAQTQDFNDTQLSAATEAIAAADYAPGAPKSPPPTQISNLDHSPKSGRDESQLKDTALEEAGGDEEEDDEDLKIQRELFAEAQARLRKGGAVETETIPPAPQTDQDVFQAIWHNYEPGSVLRFGELLPHRRAYYVPKVPLKPPKAIHPTKVNLDIQNDQEKAFRLPPSASANRNQRSNENDHKGLQFITEAEAGGEESDEDHATLDDFDPNERFGAVTDSWDIPSPDSMSEADGNEFTATGAGEMPTIFDDWDREEKARPRKKRRTDSGQGLPVFHDALPNLDEPDDVTAKTGKKVILDLNDPELLLDIQQPENARKKARPQDFRREVSGSLTKSLFRKFNISNDESYDILKHNNREKVRNITNLNSLEHSLPALELAPRDCRQLVRFEKQKSKKKKDLKGQDPKTLYAKSEDLSLRDNSNMLLLEYSEECPTTLSNFGMCNRLINYYRRKDKDDNFRPKLDLGEPVVLSPNDQSPFAIFGNVHAGETVPTLHNGMFRAPVFAHETKPTDFLVIRTTTGIHGTDWYIRNLQNLFVVGQQYPSQQVPGIHSRKVTDISKRRLKMIAYRLYNKNASKRSPLTNHMIADHLRGSDIAQNRGKMREFMQYDKEVSSWRPMPGETLPDENQMRGWISPEDICLLDAMQVGVKQLQDAGYQEDNDVAMEDEDGEATDAYVHQQLAPWNTTKNFLEASSRRAMLELHGKGDPTGRGEGISMIKTSMKGGYKPQGQSANDKMDAKARKDTGGHSYNVKEQEANYNAAINKIWEAQKASLTSTIEHSDVEMDPDDAGERVETMSRGRTPQSQYGTPATARRDDETMSQFSRFSTSSQSRNRALKIIRRIPNKYGKIEVQEELVTDPTVIRMYTERRRDEQVDSVGLGQLKPTGDEDTDARARKRLMLELQRLERNKERRQVREKAKAALSNVGIGPDGKAIGTTRKCANCNRPGHIKTNKKMCPMLNGIAATIEELENSKNKAGATAPASSAASPPGPATPQATPQQPLPEFEMTG